MSFLHKQSNECMKSELDLFHLPPTQISYETAKIVSYYPLASLEHGPIEFYIAGSAEEYIDLSQTFLHLVCKLETDAQATYNIPANYLLHSLFSQVDVLLNETLITSSVNTYPYRCLFETLLNYGHDAKNSHLQSALFYKDTAGKMDSEKDNIGGNSRASIISKGTFDLFGRLHVDLFFQDRLLINNVNLRIKLSRSKDNFYLMSDKSNSKIKIISANLSVRKVKVNPKIALAHAAVLEKSTLKYPIKRVVTKSITIQKGLSAHTIDNISTGILPKKIVFGFVGSTGFNGDWKKNCFNFEHFNLTKVNLSVDGESVPYCPIEMNFDENCYQMGFNTLFNGLDRAGLDCGNDISRTDFAGGYTLFAFDLTPDMCNGDHFNLVRHGNLRLSVNFGTALTDNINCIIYLEYENIIEIDKSRNVLFDYKV